MKGDNRSANRATFQMDQLEAKLRDVLDAEDISDLSAMIVELVELDDDMMRPDEPGLKHRLWSVMATSALLSLGREITRRATDAQS